MWPFVLRHRYNDLAARYQQAIDARDQLASTLAAERDARRIAASRYVDADTTATRLDTRLKQLTKHCAVLEDECLAAQHARELLTTQHREEVLRLERELAEARAERDGNAPVTRRRLNRALRACARYRLKLATRAHIINHLQQQLDDALGLNTPEILAGTNWQKHRADKRGLVS